MGRRRSALRRRFPANPRRMAGPSGPGAGQSPARPPRDAAPCPHRTPNRSGTTSRPIARTRSASPTGSGARPRRFTTNSAPAPNMPRCCSAKGFRGHRGRRRHPHRRHGRGGRRRPGHRHSRRIRRAARPQPGGRHRRAAAPGRAAATAMAAATTCSARRALLAACALKDWLAETGTPGRVRYYGCPAEEGGAAKTFMVRDGALRRRRRRDHLASRDDDQGHRPRTASPTPASTSPSSAAPATPPCRRIWAARRSMRPS